MKLLIEPKYLEALFGAVYVGEGGCVCVSFGVTPAAQIVFALSQIFVQLCGPSHTCGGIPSFCSVCVPMFLVSTHGLFEYFIILVCFGFFPLLLSIPEMLPSTRRDGAHIPIPGCNPLP